MTMEQNAEAMRVGSLFRLPLGRLLIGAALGMAMITGCTQPDTADSEDRHAGSGTELGNVKGVMVSSDKTPVAGVEVSLYPLEDGPSGGSILKTTTDANGAFAFQVEGGVFRLLALDGQGNGATVDSLLPSLADTIDLEQVDLQPLGGIRGYIKSQPTGSELRILGTYFDTTFAGDTEFVWEGIPAGTYWLQVEQPIGMWPENSVQIVVSVVSGVITELADTLDISVTDIKLTANELPYHLDALVRISRTLDPDSMFWMLNGVRIENQGMRPDHGRITLTTALLDSTRDNVLQIFAHFDDEVFAARTWKISWTQNETVKWAYQAVRAVVVAMEPDNRPKARRAGVQLWDPLLGSFRVLQSRVLAPEELEYWEWSAEAGGDATVSELVQAAVYNPYFPMLRGCRVTPPNRVPNFPGDTVTFFLLPDSNLGAVAYRLRTDERFEDMNHLGYFARADWPLGHAFRSFEKELELSTSLRPEGLQIEWSRSFNFQGSNSGCQSAFRRFVIDSTGRVHEKVTTPTGIDASRLLLLYRANFHYGVDADSLPTSGNYVFIDSTGQGKAGSADSSWSFQLEPSLLEELKSLFSEFPHPIPLEWQQEYRTTVWHEGLNESLRYLASNQSAELHILDHPNAAPAKADLFSRVELWLRNQGLL